MVRTITAHPGLPVGTQLPTADGWVRLGYELHPGVYRVLAYAVLPRTDTPHEHEA